MERLTCRLREDCITVEGAATYYNPRSRGALSRAITKLAAYEDTGLTPDKLGEFFMLGQTVWLIRGVPRNRRVLDGKVIQVAITADGRKIDVRVGYAVYTGQSEDLVFLTREAAEEAMAKLEECEE